MINRRFMIVPPALPSGGYAEQLGGQARNIRACSLGLIISTMLSPAHSRRKYPTPYSPDSMKWEPLEGGFEISFLYQSED